MNTANTRILSALSLAAMISSCGGDSLHGVFSDSPVAGLSYVTPSKSGVTDAAGRFNYREGETVVFSVGKLALPVAVASSMVTPLDMVASDSVTDPSVVNIARLLQSLDEDRNPDNGISLPINAAAAFTETTIFDPEDDTAVEAVVRQLYGDTRQAVSADQAVAHFVDSLSADAASTGELDQLHYIVPVGAAFDGESIYVDEQNFNLSIDGDSHTGATTVKHGVFQLASATDHWFVSVNDGVETQLACIAKSPQPVADCNGDLYHVFKDEQRAMDFGAVEEVSTRAYIEETSGLAIGAAEEAVTAATEESGAATDQNTSEQSSSAGGADTGEVTLESLFPNCSANVVDDDGDGFGWQNNASCLIVVDGVVIAEEVSSTNDSGVIEEAVVEQVEAVVEPIEVVEPEESVEVPVVESPVVDSPVVVAPEPVDTQPVVTEVIETPEATSQPEPIQEPVTEVPAIQAQDITDIIVLTGQANAAAIQTDYDPALDAGHERLFAFNTDGQWRAADLSQYWDVNLPSNYASAAEGREPYNNLAFQVGKSLTEQSDRVVGIIMITASGEGISHWDYNSAFYQQIRTKVNTALAQLPQKTSVDAMIWMQGETDWLAEGTADPGATGFASLDSDFYVNYYPNKLNQLIGNLRSEAWYGFDAQFICGETKKTSLNHHLMALNDDGDSLTSCAAASDLPTRESDPFGNHFSAAGLRTLGDRMAELYISGDQ